MSVDRQGRTFGGKRSLLFIGIVLTCFMQAGLYAGRRSSQISYRDGDQWMSIEPFSSFSNSRPVIHDHPIPRLMANAENDFRDLLSRQSSSLRKAVTEYKKRYNRDPPKGFDDWWTFAMENNVKIIDEYDGLMDDLAPFWEMSGNEFRLRAEEVSLHSVSPCIIFNA